MAKLLLDGITGDSASVHLAGERLIVSYRFKPEQSLLSLAASISHAMDRHVEIVEFRIGASDVYSGPLRDVVKPEENDDPYWVMNAYRSWMRNGKPVLPDEAVAHLLACRAWEARLEGLPTVIKELRQLRSEAEQKGLSDLVGAFSEIVRHVRMDSDESERSRNSLFHRFLSRFVSTGTTLPSL